MGRENHPAYFDRTNEPDNDIEGRLMAHLNHDQIAEFRAFFDSPDNETWVRSNDVTDNQIREASANAGTLKAPALAAYLATAGQK